MYFMLMWEYGRNIWSQFSISRNEKTNVASKYILLTSFPNVFSDSLNENSVSICLNDGFVSAMVKKDNSFLFCQRSLVQYFERRLKIFLWPFETVNALLLFLKY